MLERGFKIKSIFDIHLTVLKPLNTWGSYKVELRVIDKHGRVIKEAVKSLTEEEILNKEFNFEPEYKQININARNVNGK